MVIEMIVTDIKPQVKNKKRCSIFIDGKFAFGLSQVDVLYYKLKIGDEISAQRYEYILNETVYNNAREKAVALLGYRGRSRKELFDRLLQDYSRDIVCRVIGLLEKYGYIDDEKYARGYAADCFRLKKWGRRKIEFELRSKGVDEEVISAAIDSVIENAEISQADSAAALLQKRLRGNTCITFKEKQKHTAFLAGRGFDFDTITSAFELLEISVERDF